MPKFQVDPFQEHDEVFQGAERGVIQLRQNRTTREWFPVVVIMEGPRKGTSEYPWKGWRVPLDHDGGTVWERCHDCEREFRRDHAVKPAQIFCRQCERQFDRREQGITSDAETSSRFNDTNWKREHRPHRGGRF